MTEKATRRVAVRISDYEVWYVVFEGAEPTLIERLTVEWSPGKPALSKLASERIRRVIELARKED
jgi:hypothetical protein